MSVKVNHAGPDDANGRILPFRSTLIPSKQLNGWSVQRNDGFTDETPFHRSVQVHPPS